MSIKINEQLGM